MKMKRQHILYFSILSMLCLGMPAYAQDEDVDDDEIVVAPKKKVVKIPTYPTVEVKGQCIDAATKKP